jgi:FixJ family two-component response regulator
MIAPNHRQAASGTAPARPRPVVHVVDDDASFLRAVMRRLEAAGFEVAGFDCAAAFLSRPTRSPGCVIVDLRMPGASGLELQEALVESGEPLPVIFLTGHGDVQSSVRAMKRGAVDFLTKPVSGGELIDAVRHAIAVDARARADRQQLVELRTRYDSLTPREREVFALVSQGLLNKQIAGVLGTSERTVKAHRANVMAKLRVGSVAELTRMAERLGTPAER